MCEDGSETATGGCFGFLYESWCGHVRNLLFLGINGLVSRLPSKAYEMRFTSPGELQKHWGFYLL